MRNNLFSLGFLLLALCGIVNPARAEDWLPVSQEELKMTSEPKAPTAAAIYLYRQVDRDDNDHDQYVYSRIKILTEEGRKYADIQIPYVKGVERIHHLEARTIRPDGSIVNYDGTPFDKPIVSGRSGGLFTKTLTLSDVQVGSIIEYRYTHDYMNGFVFDSYWILSQELFTKSAKFSLVQSRWFPVRYSWPVGLPPGTEPPKVERNNKISLEVHDVAPFESEEYMPPGRELQQRVDFIYISDGNTEKDQVAYWKKFGKERFRVADKYLKKNKVIERAVASIVTADDSAETKLRKIYARVQQLRNTSYERAKSAEEIKREGIKPAEDIADVWEHGYGSSPQITWLFIALARAAGFESDPVLVSTRNVHFFNPIVMNPHQINSSIAVVKLDGKDLYLDPGSASMPFGLLPWSETVVKGLRLDKDGGKWITTPPTKLEDGLTTREANFRLTTSGTLEGTVAVTYSGLEASWRRTRQRNEDEATRKQFLEDDLRADVPVGVDVTLTNAPDWESSDLTLRAEFDIKIPGWMSGAGQRGLMAVGLFSANEKRVFKHAYRVHPLYFNFPKRSLDQIQIELPANWQIDTLPEAHDNNQKVARYKSIVTKTDNVLHLTRELDLDMVLVDKKYYGALRDFFQGVRTADEAQVVIKPGQAAGSPSLPVKSPASKGTPIKSPVKK